jgi:hypothetical protein
MSASWESRLIRRATGIKILANERLALTAGVISGELKLVVRLLS